MKKQVVLPGVLGGPPSSGLQLWLRILPAIICPPENAKTFLGSENKMSFQDIELKSPANLWTTTHPSSWLMSHVNVHQSFCLAQQPPSPASSLPQRSKFITCCKCVPLWGQHSKGNGTYPEGQAWCRWLLAPEEPGDYKNMREERRKEERNNILENIYEKLEDREYI